MFDQRSQILSCTRCKRMAPVYRRIMEDPLAFAVMSQRFERSHVDCEPIRPVAQWPRTLTYTALRKAQVYLQ